jgi:hypothetical protein
LRDPLGDRDEVGCHEFEHLLLRAGVSQERLERRERRFVVPGRRNGRREGRGGAAAGGDGRQ